MSKVGIVKYFIMVLGGCRRAVDQSASHLGKTWTNPPNPPRTLAADRLLHVGCGDENEVVLRFLHM